MDILRPKLVVGLGNPGLRYRNTRHNVGFCVLDALHKEERDGKKLRRIRRSEVRRQTIKGISFYTVQPLTYMNLSGRALDELRPVITFDPEEVLVITDCMDLPFGKIRIRKKGGSGGHNGLASIIEALGTKEFPRIRVGIGGESVNDTVDYVLGKWTPEQAEELPDVVETTVDAVGHAVRHGLDSAMNTFN